MLIIKAILFPISYSDILIKYSLDLTHITNPESEEKVTQLYVSFIKTLKPSSIRSAMDNPYTLLVT